jgi:cation-transporting ATPase 13A1
MSRRGARVLALGWKELPPMSPARVKDLPRETLEEGLNFAGFVIISCPLKPDSRAVIKEILNASHQVNIYAIIYFYRKLFSIKVCFKILYESNNK